MTAASAGQSRGAQHYGSTHARGTTVSDEASGGASQPPGMPEAADNARRSTAVHVTATRHGQREHSESFSGARREAEARGERRSCQTLSMN